MLEILCVIIGFDIQQTGLQPSEETGVALGDNQRSAQSLRSHPWVFGTGLEMLAKRLPGGAPKIPRNDGLPSFLGIRREFGNGLLYSLHPLLRAAKLCGGVARVFLAGFELRLGDVQRVRKLVHQTFGILDAVGIQVEVIDVHYILAKRACGGVHRFRGQLLTDLRLTCRATSGAKLSERISCGSFVFELFHLAPRVVVARGNGSDGSRVQFKGGLDGLYRLPISGNLIVQARQLFSLGRSIIASMCFPGFRKLGLDIGQLGIENAVMRETSGCSASPCSTCFCAVKDAL